MCRFCLDEVPLPDTLNLTQQRKVVVGAHLNLTCISARRSDAVCENQKVRACRAQLGVHAASTFSPNSALDLCTMLSSIRGVKRRERPAPPLVI